jgi:hypothetical protein
MRKIVGAEQACFFSRNGHEENRAAGPRIRAAESFGNFEQAVGAGGIVERAVIDVISVNGFT